jgi:AraC-like DNA-binding protein
MNKELLDALLGDFYTVTNMEISILSANFHTVSVKREAGKGYCSLLHTAVETLDTCKASDIENLTKAKKTASPILYTCPFGMTEAILPILRNDSIIAYIICAMGIRENDADSVAARASAVTSRITEDELCRVIAETRHLSEEEALAYFRMLKILAEHLAKDPSVTDSEESIGNLIKYYVRDNLGGKLTLSDIAKSLHCSTVTLTEHFKAEFGITIMEYATKKRMELAEKLLLATDEPLREIASMTGFSDVEYFSRTFKKHHGISPAAWRQSNR